MTAGERAQAVLDAVALSGFISTTTGRVGTDDLCEMARALTAAEQQVAELRGELSQMSADLAEAQKVASKGYYDAKMPGFLKRLAEAEAARDAAREEVAALKALLDAMSNAKTPSSAEALTEAEMAAAVARVERDAAREETARVRSIRDESWVRAVTQDACERAIKNKAVTVGNLLYFPIWSALRDALDATPTPPQPAARTEE